MWVAPPEQGAKAAGTIRHSKVAFSLASSSQVNVDSPSGPERIVVSGGVPSILKSRACWAKLPALSVARTVNV